MAGCSSAGGGSVPILCPHAPDGKRPEVEVFTTRMNIFFKGEYREDKEDERSEDKSDNLTLVINVQMAIWTNARMTMMSITLRMTNLRMQMTNLSMQMTNLRMRMANLRMRMANLRMRMANLRMTKACMLVESGKQTPAAELQT